MEKLRKHLIDELGQSEEAALQVAKKISKHDDILEELEHWIDNRELQKSNPLRVEGYAAEDISKLAPFMETVGLYSFLVTLRERPEVGKIIISNGFRHDRVVQKPDERVMRLFEEKRRNGAARGWLA